MRRIAIVTGTRAEYGILRPAIDKIDFAPSMEMKLVVTGMHLSPEYGMTVRDIQLDGIPIETRVDMLLGADTTAAMGKSLGVGVTGLTQELERLKPDAVMVLGDRIEAFAGAIAGLFCGALLVHIHGGEITGGGVDEYMRHAITKLCHVHFAATESAKQRIVNMGEHPDFVLHTGSPALDELRTCKKLTRQELREKLGFELPERYVMMVQHSISTSPGTAELEIVETLEALKACGVPVILGYPNADAGSSAIRESIRRYEAKNWLYTYVHLPRLQYIGLMKHASAMVGNSSSGLIDTPFFGLPSVTIGDRQKGRDRGENVIEAPASDRDAIQNAVQKALTDETFIQQAKAAENPYGDGYASDKILGVMETLDYVRARNCKRLPW